MEALGQVGGALAVSALRERKELRDLLCKAQAAHTSCHLNLAACATKARSAGGCWLCCPLETLSLLGSSFCLCPPSRAACVSLATAQSGEHAAAEAHCREALREDPRRVKSHFRLAQARYAAHTLRRLPPAHVYAIRPGAAGAEQGG